MSIVSQQSMSVSITISLQLSVSVSASVSAADGLTTSVCRCVCHYNYLVFAAPLEIRTEPGSGMPQISNADLKCPLNCVGCDIKTFSYDKLGGHIEYELIPQNAKQQIVCK